MVAFAGLAAVGLFFSESLIRWVKTRQRSVVGRGRLRAVAEILSQYSVSNLSAENRLARIWEQAEPTGSPIVELEGYERAWWERLGELMKLRALVFGNEGRGMERLRHGFAFRSELGREPFPVWENDRRVVDSEHLTPSGIAVAGTEVAALYWHLFLTCTGEYPELKPFARRLYQEIFNEPFKEANAKLRVESLVDRMQGEAGVGFLMLNLLTRQDFAQARALGRFLVERKEASNEEFVTTLYWISELTWFLREDGISARPLEYSDVIRNLYHLCFVAPERAGFLEIDSQFFSEFGAISEMAREAFLFVDGLFERVLELWKRHDGYFDPTFLRVVEGLAGVSSKVHQELQDWERVWKRTEGFCQEFLYIVEGNLSYANGDFEEAVACYQRALAVTPTLRSARLNLLFCYARLNERSRHDALAKQVVADAKLHPSAWYVVGNSYLLAGDVKTAESYYGTLAKLPGWDAKVDFYKSTFCYEHGMWADALHFARLAQQKNPTDSSIRYHLSLCFDRLGKKQKALDALRGLGDELFSDWLSFYRFTLERDSGMTKNASQTLRQISGHYFRHESEDWEQAILHAKESGDLELLRHLKRVVR